MATKIKKIHYIFDEEKEHHKAVFEWKDEVSTPFLVNEVWRSIRAAEQMNDESFNFPLFDKNNLAAIVEEVGYHERLFLFLRPRYVLEHIITEPEDLIVDVQVSEGERLLYSFYNPTKRHSIRISCRLGEDLSGVYRKIASRPEDLQLRQYFIKLALEEATFDSEPRKRVPELMTVEQVAEYLQLQEKTIRNWVAGKAIPFKKAGSAVRFSKSEIDQAMEEGKLGNKIEKVKSTRARTS